METDVPSRRGRKRRGGGKRKRNTSHNSDDEKTQETPKVQEEEEKEEEKQEEEEKEDKTPKPWSCPACTFLNGASRCFCEMCETPNPSPPAATARIFGGAVAATEWNCAACTMVNPAALRVCAVCGTLNPRPPGLSIARSLGRDGDESFSSSSNDSLDDDSDSDDEEEEDDAAWFCQNCDTLAAGRTCPDCFAQRPKVARKEKDEKESKEEKKQALLKRRRRRKREKKLHDRAKMAYGVSIYELKKLMLEPTSSQLVDTLQTLTHTLAMMDASADNEWADGPAFLIRSLGGGMPSSETAKDPELLTVLADIFRGQERTYPVEVRLLAVQSINYLMKMDRHMFARAQLVEVVGLYLTDLLDWKNNKSKKNTPKSGDAKSAHMIVEECLSGLSSMSSTEAVALRELLAQGNFVGYLDFLLSLVDSDEEKDGGFHPSIVTTALGILQKCCMRLRWTGTRGKRPRSSGQCKAQKAAVSRSPSQKTTQDAQQGQLTLELAIKLVDFLRHVLQHKHIPLHVKAAKCLLVIFHRTPYDQPEIIGKLVTPEVLRKFVAVVVNASGEESEESRLSMVSLLLHVFDDRPQLVSMFVHEKIYTELFGGMLPLLQSSSTGLRSNALKLTAMLTRVVCRKHSLRSANSSARNSIDASDRKQSASTSSGSAACSPRNRRNRKRVNSLPDPDVLSTLLLDFIRANSVPAVNVLLKDGADLNFPKMFDVQGHEIDKPLNVAVECASLGMVRLLLKRGADIHQVGIGGTALHVAAKTGRCDVASFLLQCGARVQAKDRNKKTVMDILTSADATETAVDSIATSPSPMKKLLELHQQSAGLHEDDSDLSENDEMPAGRNRAWFYPSDEDDEDDDIDEDEIEGGEGYGMDYDDEDEEGFDGHLDEMDDEEIPSDEDTSNYNDDMANEARLSRKHHFDSIASESETKTEDECLDSSGNGSMSYNPRNRESSGSDKLCIDDDTPLEQNAFIATADDVYGFSLAITQCLLAVLHDMDIQNVDRSVVSTVACVLEMAPSRLIRTFKEVDVVLILDTVHFLLQGEKQHQSNSDALSAQASTAATSLSAGGGSNVSGGAAPAAHNSNLASFILAVRILQAMVRKSSKESSIFHQIERRGIREQIEQLNDASACWVSPTLDENSPRSFRDTIFGRGLDLLKSLRADMLESGMLHLHKLRNLARRLKEVTDASPSCEKELILVDLVELFEQPNSITTYEFKQSELLPAVIQYLSPRGELDEIRAIALMRAFECCPSALKHLIFRLQSIITQDEAFPVVSFNTGKGRELYPLTRQLRIAFMRPGDRNAGDKQHGSTPGRSKAKSMHASPLTHFQSFERTVSRCMPVVDSDLSLLYLNLVGHSIQKVVEGKWKKFLVVGYDDVRSHHLIKPIGDGDDNLTEMVLHDSQCKLIGSVDVYEQVALDLGLFGSLDTSSCGSSSDGKKKRKNNKRKRRASAQKQSLQLDSGGACRVEVINEGDVKMPTLPGAWYAAVLVDESGEVRKLSDGKQTRKEMLAAQDTHSVKLLANSRVIQNVPVKSLRPRKQQPQVGSVVEVDGAMGEVTRVYDDSSNSPKAGNTASKLLDVKIGAGIEKSRVKKDRVHFPPHQAATPKYGGEGDRIEAMSIQRLFPGRDSSLQIGSVGDRVWVLPPSGSRLKDLCVAGTIKSFPSGLDSIRDSTSVQVEISFGSAQSPVAVRVKQDRVLNLAIDGGGSSRLLAALQMASGRGGASRLFGGGQSGQGNSSAIQRAFERVAGLHQNRFGSGLGSSGTAIDQIRNLISRNSAFNGSHPPRDVETIEQHSANAQTLDTSSPPNEPIGSEIQTEEEASMALSSSTKASKKRKETVRGRTAEENLSAVQEFLKPEGAKPKMVCSQLPKVNLVVGFRKCDVTASAQDRIIVSSEFGLQRVDKGIASTDTPATSLFIQRNSSTLRFEAKSGARRAWLELFNSFSADAPVMASQKKKKRKLSPSSHKRAVSNGAPWDIEKFIAFMLAVRGPTTYGGSGSNAKYCVLFSKFADPDTSRRLLKPDGFILLLIHECKDASKAKQLLQFLRSQGYSEKALNTNASRSSSGDEEEKASPASSGSGRSKEDLAKMSSNKMLRQPVVLRGFSADQNVLKCVEDLRHAYQSRAGSNTSYSGDGDLPPWKLTYKLYCDFQVEWETQSPSNSKFALGLGVDSIEPLATLMARSPTRLLSHGVVTLDDMDGNGATEASRWLSRIVTSQTSGGSRGGLVVPDSVASAIRLLCYLFQFRTDMTSLDETLWTSPRLYNKLETQLQDVLSMCSGIYPPWCDALVTHCKFFFPRELREKIFRSTSFGCTRSLHWFRNQLNVEEGSADSASSIVGGGIYNQEISISPIPKERVKVHRENILQSAEAVMKMHAKRKAILDVVFVGEKGYGSGVTAAFYSTTAHVLQSVTENQKNRYWIPGDGDVSEVMRAEARGVDGDDVADVGAAIRHSNGLFPFPHRTPSAKLLERFRMMGRLAGKALMDERLLPLPLSPQFMKLVVGESFGLEELGDIFLSHGRILYSIYKASKKLAAGENDVQIDQMDVKDWLEAVGFTFIDPFTQEPLVTGGESIAVTASNLTLYLRAVLESWLDSGIRAQVLAFRDGISEVLPLGKLRLLFIPELLALLCGEDDIKWDAASLLKDTKLAHGYTKESQPVKFFFEVLEDMSGVERRSFLLYATGCPNLPPGGFQALKPSFEVVRRVVDNLDVDRALPFARTCTNTLHLPAYSSKAVMEKQMNFAIANSRGVIDRD